MLYNRRQPTLRPTDVVIALWLAIEPEALLKDISAKVLLSVGEVHNGLRRLTAGGLLLPGERATAIPALLPFLLHGVPRTYPAMIGAESAGVRTAYIPGSADHEDGPRATEHVWPSPDGQWRGQSLIPLHPRAPELVSHNPQLADLLHLVDLLRVGGAREQQAAESELWKRLAPGKA